MTYKEEMEAWVTGHTGGSMLEVVLIAAVPLAFLCLLRLRTPSPSSYVVEIAALAWSFVVSCTFTTAGLCAGALAAIRSLWWLAFGRRNESAAVKEKRLAFLSDSRRPFLVTYRALMMVYTCVAILAVDFRIFPRRFAKVETFGISMMDVGVGSFVFSQGVISARMMAAGKRATVKDVLKACMGCLPLLALGFTRLLMVKASDYQEHTSEYGVHWNFFFTLGFLTPLVAMARLIGPNLNPAVLGVLIITGYQIVLSHFGLEQWVLTAERTNLVSANKEGLCSLAGYLSIFFFGAAVGDLILQQYKSLVDWRRLFWRLLAVDLALWSMYAAADAFGILTSRRLTNFMYVLCLVAFNLLHLSLSLAIDLYMPIGTSTLLTAINRNQLAVFLAANLLTGAVNKTVYTLYQPPAMALGILLLYAAAFSFAALLWHRFNLTLKFW